MDSNGEAALTKLELTTSRILMEVAESLTKIPFAFWQRLAFELRARADKTKNPFDESTAQDAWNVVTYMQRQTRIAMDGMRASRADERFKEFDFSKVPVPEEEE
jgi:hypothetical protein